MRLGTKLKLKLFLGGDWCGEVTRVQKRFCMAKTYKIKIKKRKLFSRLWSPPPPPSSSHAIVQAVEPRWITLLFACILTVLVNEISVV